MKRIIILIIATLAILAPLSRGQCQLVRGLRQTTTRGNCPGGNCPLQRAESQTPATVSEEEAGKRMQAEVALRGSAVVKTSPEIQATPDDMAIRALTLPESDAEYYHVLLFHKEGDSAAKGLLEYWKQSETLLAIANPDNPVDAATMSRWQTVNVEDPAAQDLVKAYKIEQTPTLVIQSPGVDYAGIRANTVLTTVIGWDNNGKEYETTILNAFKQGIKKAQTGQIVSFEQTEKRNVVKGGAAVKCDLQPIPTTLEKSRPGKGPWVDVNVTVPESERAVTAWESLCQTAEKGIWWIVLGILGLMAIPSVKSIFSNVKKWFTNQVNQNKNEKDLKEQLKALNAQIQEMKEKEKNDDKNS